MPAHRGDSAPSVGGHPFYSAAVLWGKTIGQHPQAVGDVCPLLVRQATLGRRQGDGIGGRLVRAAAPNTRVPKHGRLGLPAD